MKARRPSNPIEIKTSQVPIRAPLQKKVTVTIIPLILTFDGIYSMKSIFLLSIAFNFLLTFNTFGSSSSQHSLYYNVKNIKTGKIEKVFSSKLRIHDSSSDFFGIKINPKYDVPVIKADQTTKNDILKNQEPAFLVYKFTKKQKLFDIQSLYRPFIHDFGSIRPKGDSRNEILFFGTKEFLGKMLSSLQTLEGKVL